jgi:hypothetical protein
MNFSAAELNQFRLEAAERERKQKAEQQRRTGAGTDAAEPRVHPADAFSDLPAGHGKVMARLLAIPQLAPAARALLAKLREPKAKNGPRVADDTRYDNRIVAMSLADGDALSRFDATLGRDKVPNRGPDDALRRQPQDTATVDMRIERLTASGRITAAHREKLLAELQANPILFDGLGRAMANRVEMKVAALEELPPGAMLGDEAAATAALMEKLDMTLGRK